MRRVKRSMFFIVLIAIAVFTVLNITGIKVQRGDFLDTYIKSIDDIRWGIDIRGGVDVTFAPADGYDASDLELDRTQAKMEERLASLNITDSEVYVDYSNDRVIVRFPWKEGEADFNPEQAVQELGETAFLTFREGYELDEETGERTGVTEENIILVGEDVKLAAPSFDSNTDEYYVALELSDEGAQKFSDATEKLAEEQGSISIWMDNVVISNATVNEHITGGSVQITGNFTAEEATDLANKINSGALPFGLDTVGLNILSPTDGENARDSMILSGAIAFIAIAVIMIILYRLPGFVAMIALFGQLVGTIACLTGFFGFFDSFTLTIPGIAGIILALGIGVDANIITAERIREELRKGKSLDGSLHLGFSKAFTAIFDGNITVVLIALILMGSFGPPTNIMSTILSPLFFMFGPSTTGEIYSFGFTLLVGVIMNFVFGVFASRLMLSSLSKFKGLRKINLYDRTRKNTEEKVYNFVGKKKTFFSISSAIIVVTLIVSLIAGVVVSIEFKGGSIISYSYTGSVSADEIDTIASEVVGADVTVNQGENFADGSDYFEISFTADEGLTAEKQETLTTKITEKYPEGNISLLNTSDVNSTLGNEFFQKCLVAVAFAFLVLVLYIAFRFKRISGWSAGAMALVALLHDVIIVYAAFVIFRMPIDANFMAVVLTILGYSINDTIVIYDRIRENKKLMPKNTPVAMLVNTSVSQTLTRSVTTTVTTVIALLIITIVALLTGVNSIISFSLPLIVGLISGTYSSICIATPLWVMWQEHKEKKQTNDYAKK